mmetsp:Transcript_41119/g.62495  ORF Transcript_41119/g.62495 Transcript_41119/m.62495 type:complete len:246 (-) Transcript_41119:1490-2227(-)
MAEKAEQFVLFDIHEDALNGVNVTSRLDSERQAEVDLLNANDPNALGEDVFLFVLEHALHLGIDRLDSALRVHLGPEVLLRKNPLLLVADLLSLLVLEEGEYAAPVCRLEGEVEGVGCSSVGGEHVVEVPEENNDDPEGGLKLVHHIAYGPDVDPIVDGLHLVPFFIVPQAPVEAAGLLPVEAIEVEVVGAAVGDHAEHVAEAEGWQVLEDRAHRLHVAHRHGLLRVEELVSQVNVREDELDNQI